MNAWTNRAVVDACGTWNKLVRDTAVARMAQAGVEPVTWVAVGAAPPGDRRNPVAGRHARAMAGHLPFHGDLVGGFQAAKGA